MEERFEAISGVVDTDTYINVINFPFHWKKWNSADPFEKRGAHDSSNSI